MYVNPLCVWSLISIIVAHNVTRFPITVSDGTRSLVSSWISTYYITDHATNHNWDFWWMSRTLPMSFWVHNNHWSDSKSGSIYWKCKNNHKNSCHLNFGITPFLAKVQNCVASIQSHPWLRCLLHRKLPFSFWFCSVLFSQQNITDKICIYSAKM